MQEFRDKYNEWGMWIILLKGMTPIPYKLVTITSGFAGYNFGLFVVLSVITRGIRFFLVAGLVSYYGEPIREFCRAAPGGRGAGLCGRHRLWIFDRSICCIACRNPAPDGWSC